MTGKMTPSRARRDARFFLPGVCFSETPDPTEPPDKHAEPLSRHPTNPLTRQTPQSDNTPLALTLSPVASSTVHLNRVQNLFGGGDV